MIEDMPEYQREWYHAKRAGNPDYAAKRKAYRLANHERIREQEKRSRAKTIDKHRADSKVRMAKLRAERPEHVATIRYRADLKRKYGLTPDERAAILETQGGVCAICRGGPGNQGWHTDHCHTTKRVRGLLCSHCNLMLGHAKDDPVRLKAAIEYLCTPPYSGE